MGAVKVKVKDILADVDLKNPNDVPVETKYGWLTVVEKQLLDECMLTHELSEDELQKAASMYAMEQVGDEYVLLAQPPYHDLYVQWVNAQIALVNLDNDAYANYQTLFNNALLTFKNYFNRTHRARIGGPKFLF